MNSKIASSNDKDVFEQLIRHEGLKRLRPTLDPLLGAPIWWISFKPNGGDLKRVITTSQEVWGDPRVRHLSCWAAIGSWLKRRSKETQPFFFDTSGSVRHLCVPLMSESRRIGYLGLVGIKKNFGTPAINALLHSLSLLIENASKGEELNRLSATIRPRAVALSTVHTVHRIINSTLNLDELVSRLAHLTAQVLRVNRCSIFLVDRSERKSNGKGARQSLICKALVGFPKNVVKGFRVGFGHGTEGHVAKSAEILLRKKFMCIPLIDEDVIGVVLVSRKKNKKEFNYFDLEILTTLSEEAVIAIKNAQLYEEQKKVTLGTIQSLAVILGNRVSTSATPFPPEVFLKLALHVAHELKLGEEDTQALHYATLLKDTAKVGIPYEILKKPSKLTGEEYTSLKEHTIKGARIVQYFESLKPVAPIILYSREKFDGTGYPEGLKGDKIPIGARILAVINAFEAIITGRPYRDQASVADALDEIRKNGGTQFDPKVVEAFVNVAVREGRRLFAKRLPEH